MIKKIIPFLCLINSAYAFVPGISPNDLSLFVKEASGINQTQVPVIANMWVGRGQYFKDDIGVCLKTSLSCSQIPAQINILSHWPDGSIQHFMAAFKQDVSAYGLYEYRFSQTGGSVLTGYPQTNINPDLLKINVELVNKAGEKWKYELKSGQPILDYVKNNSFVSNLMGPIVQEIKIGVPLKKAGVESGQFYLIMRWQIFDGGSATVEAQLLNAPLKSKTNPSQPYAPDDAEITTGFIKIAGGVVVTLDGKIFHDQTMLTQRKSVGTQKPRLIVRENPSYLAKNGIVPWFFNAANPVTAGQVQKRFKTQLNDSRINFVNYSLGQVFEPYPLAQAMNQTGDRAEIGPMSDFGVAAFNSLSTEAEDLFLVENTNALSSFAVFAYDRDNDSFVVPYNDGRMKDLRAHRIKPKTAPDRAHSPNACELYILLGHDVNRQICEAYGSYSYNRWPYNGIEQYYGSRDSAWSKRNGYSAYLTAIDNSIAKTYFKERIEASFTNYSAQVFDSAKVLHTSGIGVFNPGGRERAVPMLIESPWQYAWHVAIDGYICRSLGLQSACDEYKHLAKYFTDAATTAVGTSWLAPDGTNIVWNSDDFKRVIDYSVPWGTYTPYIDKSGNIAVTKATDKPLQTYAEMKWWQKLYVDYGYIGKSDQPAFPLPDASPLNWKTKAGYSDIPYPSSSWIEYALHSLSVAVANDLVIGGDILYSKVKPDIDKNISEFGLRQIKY